jgi:hypothetical protein
VAVLKGIGQEEYITPVLRRCADSAEVWIKRSGALAVRDAVEARPDAELKDLSAFNTQPEVATRLASLAGQCLTSVAKLIHDELKREVSGDYLWMIREDQGGLPLPVFDVTGVRPGTSEVSAEEQADIIHRFDPHEMFAGPGTFLFKVTDRSLLPIHILPGDCLILRRGHEPGADDVVVLVDKARPVVKKVVARGGKGPNQRLLLVDVGADKGPPLALDDARDSIIGVFFGSLRLSI